MKLSIDNIARGYDQPCYIIAEMSANHGSSLDVALETVRAAARAGANAIKLQTYRGSTITLDSKTDDFLISGTLWDGRYLYDLYEVAHLPWEWHLPIMEEANRNGIECFSSPFDKSAVDFLEELDVPAYKIASFEITDIPLIEYVASKGKPIIISTGIAELTDMELAIAACKKVGNNKIVLLKCTSSYPAPIDEANLKMIDDFRSRFGVVAGLSDHTMGITVPIVAITQGAKVIEKHFILNKNVKSEDAAFSLDEEEFSNMVKAVREAEASLGKVDYNLTDKQKSGRSFSRSLYVAAYIEKGDIITNENVKSVRPGYGLHPKYLPEILGKRVNMDLKMGDRMTIEYVEDGESK